VSEALPLVGFSSAYMSRYVLAFVRVMAALSLNPVLGSARVPVPWRIGLGLFVTLILFPPTSEGPPVSLGPTEIAGEPIIAVLAGVAPQLNLFALGLPAKIVIALAALTVALPVMLPRITAMFQAVPDTMLFLAR